MKGVPVRVLYFFSALFFCFSFLVSDHYPPWVGYYNELGVGVAFVLLVAAFLCTSAVKVQVPSEAIFFCALSLIPFAQLGVGLIFFSGSAWVVFLYLSSVVIAVVVGRSWAECGVSAAPQFFFVALLVAVVFSALLALYQAFGFYFLGNWAVIVAPGQRSGGNLAQPNQLATLLLFGVVALVYAFERRILSSHVTGMLMLLVGAGLIATQSRAGLLGCLWLLFWLFVSKRRGNFRLSVRLAVILIILVAAGGFYFDQIQREFENLSGYHLSGRGESGASRLDVGSRPAHWSILIDAAASRPWFGYGWDQVAVAHSSFALRHKAVSGWFQYAHNLPLDVILWCGIPLGLVVISVSVVWVCRNLFNSVELLDSCMLAALGCLFVHSLFEYPHAYIYFLIPAGCAVGWLSKSSRCLSLPRSFFSVYAVAVFGIFVAVVIDYGVVERNYRDLRMQHARIGMLEIDRDVPDLLVLNQLQGLLFAGRVEVRKNMSSADLDRLMFVALRYPYPPVLLNSGLAFGLNGREADAAFSLQLLCRRHHPAMCDWALENWRDSVRTFPELGVIPTPSIHDKLKLRPVVE